VFLPELVTRSPSACPAAGHPNRFAADLDAGARRSAWATAFARAKEVYGADNASAFERSVATFAVAERLPPLRAGASAFG